ncbi:MAG: hypothetical protein ACOC5M_02040 [Chloroflexota bacterium]
MSKGVSVEKVNEAINACERERESRREDFGHDPKAQREMVFEMNVTLDVLRWAKAILTMGDSGDDGGRSQNGNHAFRGRRR